jgi:hypothetical protein
LKTQAKVDSFASTGVSNGSGAAAILAAGIGSFLLGVLSIAADKSVFLKDMFRFYGPTGPLSGVTTTAILIWLLVWGILEWRWRKRTIAVARVCGAALVLLGLSLMLTFPPVGDLF